MRHAIKIDTIGIRDCDCMLDSVYTCANFIPQFHSYDDVAT